MVILAKNYIRDTETLYCLEIYANTLVDGINSTAAITDDFIIFDEDSNMDGRPPSYLFTSPHIAGLTDEPSIHAKLQALLKYTEAELLIRGIDARGRLSRGDFVGMRGNNRQIFRPDVFNDYPYNNPFLKNPFNAEVESDLHPNKLGAFLNLAAHNVEILDVLKRFIEPPNFPDLFAVFEMLLNHAQPYLVEGWKSKKDSEADKFKCTANNAVPGGVPGRHSPHPNGAELQRMELNVAYEAIRKMVYDWFRAKTPSQ